MENKKNLPNIPIYIGDWERDCNVLSLESEAAWMRIVFKLWTKGKQNSIKMPTKSIQNLWRCSEDKMHEILNDLIFNEIAEIKVDKEFIEFSCRRFVKENNLSEIRSKASKGNKNSIKKEKIYKQKVNKKTQNTDIDNENENIDINNKMTDEEKINWFKDQVKQTDIFKSKKYKDEMFIHFTEYWTAETKSKKLFFETQKTFSFQARLRTWINNDQKYRDL